MNAPLQTPRTGFAQTATSAPNAISINSYTCACDRQAVSPSGEGLPAGWQRKVVNGVNGIQTVVVCPDCADFEAAEDEKRRTATTRLDLSNGKLVRALAAIHKAGSNPCPEPSRRMAADCRTHACPEPSRRDSSSAIDDAPAHADLGMALASPPQKRTRLWQIKLIFHSDKGATQTEIIVGAADPLAATDIMRSIDRFRLAELVSIIVTPAPLDLGTAA